MASIAIMALGAVLNAAAFTGGNLIAKAVSKDDSDRADALAETKRHNLANEAFQKANEEYTRQQEAYDQWVETSSLQNSEADSHLRETDHNLELYRKFHPDGRTLSPPKKPVFSDFYKPSEIQKKGELIFVGTSAVALCYAAFRFI